MREDPTEYQRLADYYAVKAKINEVRAELRNLPEDDTSTFRLELIHPRDDNPKINTSVRFTWIDTYDSRVAACIDEFITKLEELATDHHTHKE